MIYSPTKDLTANRPAPGLGLAGSWKCATCQLFKSQNQKQGCKKSRIGGWNCAECVKGGAK